MEKSYLWVNSIYAAADWMGILKNSIKETRHIGSLCGWLHKELEPLQGRRDCMRRLFSDSKDICVLGSHETTVNPRDLP